MRALRAARPAAHRSPHALLSAAQRAGGPSRLRSWAAAPWWATSRGQTRTRRRWPAARTWSSCRPRCPRCCPPPTPTTRRCEGADAAGAAGPAGKQGWPLWPLRYRSWPPTPRTMPACLAAQPRPAPPPWLQVWGFEPGQEPERIDWVGQRAQVDLALKHGLQQVVLVSSMGVTQADHPLNRMGKILVGAGWMAGGRPVGPAEGRVKGAAVSRMQAERPNRPALPCAVRTPTPPPSRCAAVEAVCRDVPHCARHQPDGLHRHPPRRPHRPAGRAAAGGWAGSRRARCGSTPPGSPQAGSRS